MPGSSTDSTPTPVEELAEILLAIAEEADRTEPGESAENSGTAALRSGNPWHLERRAEEIEADARLYTERLQNKREREAAEAEQREAAEETAVDLQVQVSGQESSDEDDDFEEMATPEDRRLEQKSKEQGQRAQSTPTLIPRTRRRLSPTPEPFIDREPAEVDKPDIDKLFVRVRSVARGDEMLHTFKHHVDWTDAVSVNRLNKWRQQIFRRNLGLARLPVVTFSKDENDFLINAHQQDPMDDWDTIAEEFNALFEGTVQIGAKEPRARRTAQGLRTQRGRVPEIRAIMKKDYRAKEFAGRVARRMAKPSAAEPSTTTSVKRKRKASPVETGIEEDTHDTFDEETLANSRGGLDTEEANVDYDEEKEEAPETPKGKRKERTGDISPPRRKKQRNS